jgi:hypothetical protein
VFFKLNLDPSLDANPRRRTASLVFTRFLLFLLDLFFYENSCYRVRVAVNMR